MRYTGAEKFESMNNGFAKIYSSVLKFLEPLSVEKTCEIIVKEGIAITGASYGSILLLENDQFKRVYSTLPQLTLNAIQEKGVRKRGFTFQSFKKREILVKYQKVFKRYHPEIAQLGIQTDLFIPMSYKKQALGTLILNFTNRQIFKKSDISFLKLLGSMTSLAVRKSQLYDETKKALETRNFFISTAAHEIRTPVTTIFGYSQLLLNNINTEKKIKPEWIYSLHGECNRLRYLINDLLEASHISRGYIRYSFKESSLKAIVSRAINNFQFIHPGRSLTIKDELKDKHDIVIGDYDRLMQVFINLLDNAAKFSSTATKIMLTLKTEESNFIIRIKDKGKGIPGKELPKIFDRYYRGVGTQFEGLGLGLFLVKNIIEHHQGSIEIKSKPSEGTLIEIRLPRRRVGGKR